MKIVTKKNITGTLMALAGIMSLVPVYAADMLAIQINMQGSVQAGHATDGQRLGQGVIVFHDAHKGFRVWSDGLRYSDLSGRYVLVGSNNPDHRLRVRMEGEDWQPDNKTGGILLYSGDDIGHFYISVDGEQFVAADRYSLQVNGAAILLD
ncbi:TPA: hypothetical protein PGG59_005183 [Raoultella planticola]|nr:hypothetical protein [Raoultella planticola]